MYYILLSFHLPVKLNWDSNIDWGGKMAKKRYDIGIVDGNNMFFKAFSVHKDACVKIDDKKVFTGGTFGLINSILTIKRDYLKDDAMVIIAWDRGYKRRSAIYPEYKANRANKDEWEDYENFKTQIEQARRVLNIIGIRQAFKEGEEADDICGTLSKSHMEAGKEVLLISADKDYQQLIDDSVNLLAHKGSNNIKLWTRETWKEDRGYDPKYFSYYLALNGDAGDNIPGINGIGEKTADKFLIEHFELVDGIIKCQPIELFIPEKRSAAMNKLLQGQDMLRLSYQLSLIDKNIRGIRIQKLQKDMEKVEEVFETLKFHSLLTKNNMKLLEGL